MKIAHLADVHLGYRAYSRLNTSGINQRESDVFRAFRSALDLICQQDVDLVIIAGDLFHSVRPSNLTINQTFSQFNDFRKKSPAPIVIIGGNHDTPKSVETGCILDLYRQIEGVHVYHHGFSGIEFPDLDARVYCLPYFALEERYQYLIQPEGGAAVNILAVHGSVEGVMRYGYEAVEIKPGELNLDKWSYVALGHYHIHTQVADNAFYSGATEFTSTNIWEETRGPEKGYIIFDTVTGSSRHFAIPGVRLVIEKRVENAESFGPEEMMERIIAAVHAIPGEIDGKIVRLVIEGFPRELQKNLDWELLRQFKAQALNFDIVLRPKETESASSGEHSAGVLHSIEDEWERYALSVSDLPKGVERDRLIQLGKEYLIKASEQETML